MDISTKWDERYNSKDYIFGTKPNVFFKTQIDSLEPRKLLLPGDGEGRNAVYASQQKWEVDAIDASQIGKNKALQLATKQNVKIQYFVENLITVELQKNYYNAIGLIYFHLDPAFRTQIHQKIVQSLAPNGFVIIEAFNKGQLKYTSGGPKDEAMLYDPTMLSNDFKSLKIIMMEETIIKLNEGKGHVGDASVIRMVAQKIH